MLDLAASGGFCGGDVIIHDNWSGHVGSVGQQLERELLQEYGVDTVPLPCYCPELNQIELVWASTKMWMRRLWRGGLDETLFALQSCLDHHDHGSIYKLYQHRGYCP